MMKARPNCSMTAYRALMSTSGSTALSVVNRHERIQFSTPVLPVHWLHLVHIHVEDIHLNPGQAYVPCLADVREEDLCHTAVPEIVPVYSVLHAELRLHRELMVHVQHIEIVIDHHLAGKEIPHCRIPAKHLVIEVKLFEEESSVYLSTNWHRRQPHEQAVTRQSLRQALTHHLKVHLVSVKGLWTISEKKMTKTTRGQWTYDHRCI